MVVLPCWNKIDLLVFERNWATRINTKCVGRYQCDGRMDGSRCFPSSMTLQIVSMFEYGYDVYITATDGERRGRRTRRRSVTLPMYAIIFCQNPAAAAAALIECIMLPLPLTSEMDGRAASHIATYADASRMRRQTTDVWAFCNFHLSSIQYLAHNRQRAQLW